ncbi:thioredoxin family protein [Listeria sp. FSL L7-1435]|uniref:thioredoxin family protein n=1 Tax=Listeria cossartiae TaxID=2838249 RepID=UPI0016293D9F|nr:thioredoxin family protein [Listeria cossartiae subsp. cossartiae]
MKKLILIILGGICIFAIVTLVMSDQKENYYQKISTKEAKDIISSSGDELIYFYKKGCAACNSFKPILNAKIKEDNVKVYAIDVEAKENEGEFRRKLSWSW